MGAPGTTPVRLAGGAGSSVVQPGWTADGRLVFAWDIEGIWRLWAWDGQGLRLLDPTGAEQAGPLWQLGSTWWDAAPDGRIVQARVREGFWSLAIDRVPVPAPFVELGEVRCDARHAVARAGFPDRPPAIVALDRRDRSWRVVRAAGPLELGPGWIAAARPVTAGEAHAFFYPPTNPDIAAPAGTRPPLIVRSHGGPTAAASPALKLAWQYWTSRGFALVDVNYRGSTGWGRGYREALNGQWGIADVEDCVAAVRTLVAAGEVDPERVVIAGGSAGGFTTLSALTFTAGVFRAGVSWYGIGDLEALLHDTHKFESRYLDRLVGPWPAAAATYRARSPIHHVERLTTPVLFLQGEDDRVVPPSQTRAMAEALRAKGVPVEVRLYPGEGHGFRKAETQIDALEAELAFYRRVLALG
jgi:dipeptidyl aminopeptidase/acylaminoacyl peptidase